MHNHETLRPFFTKYGYASHVQIFPDTNMHQPWTFLYCADTVWRVVRLTCSVWVKTEGENDGTCKRHEWQRRSWQRRWTDAMSAQKCSKEVEDGGGRMWWGSGTQSQQGEVRETLEGGVIGVMAQIDPQIVTCVEKWCPCVDRNSSVWRVAHTSV